MNITSPSAEIITESNPLKRIELCGRVCYKSEAKITEGSARTFVEKIIKRGHTSVLEHFRLPVFPGEKLDLLRERLQSLSDVNEIYASQVMGRIATHPNHVTLNARDYFIVFPEAGIEGLAGEENADDYMTVRFVCDRAIANELVRHRVFSFSQESTRYVNYKEGVTFVSPEPYGDNTAWFAAMKAAEKSYIAMIEAGCAPQEARNVLPLSTKTELVMTGTLRQWEVMLKLRRMKGAHPQMVYLMNRLVSNENFPEGIEGEK